VHDPVSVPGLAPLAGLLVLLELAVGTTAAAYLVDLIAGVGRGFVGTTAVICAAVMGVDLLIAVNVPPDTSILGAPLPPGSLGDLIQWSLIFTLVLLGYAFFCAVGTVAARRVVGAATLGIGGVALAKAAVTFGPMAGGVPAAVLVFVPATFVVGSTLAGMLLGHWYLVAPSLSFRPLRRAIDLVFGAVGAQALILGLVLLTASPAARDQLLRTQYALAFWLLVVGAGLVFTTAVAVLTRYFARMRANQPATAMLYVLIISAVMGVVPAHLLFFVTGTPV
jgi:hypothetical protein